MNISENIQSIEVTLPAGGGAADPVETALNVYGNTLLELWLSAGVSGNIYARIADSQNSVVPVSGFVNIPIGPLNLHLERKLEGPPWRLLIQAYNTGGFSSQLWVIAKYGDIRETDTQARVLEELTRIRELIEHKFTGSVLKEIER